MSWLWYILLAFLAFIVHFIYTRIVVPYMTYRSYKGIANVWTPHQFIPILGEFYECLKLFKAGMKYYYHLETRNAELKDKDLELIFYGPRSCMRVVSNDAHKEFGDLVPHKIDRDILDTNVGRMMPHATGMIMTTPNLRLRKKLMLQVLGLNQSSKYVPRMVERIIETTSTWTDPEESKDVIYELFRFNFNVLHEVFAGSDTKHLFQAKYPYKNHQNEIEHHMFVDLFLKVTDDFDMQYLNPMTQLFPFVTQFEIVDPFKRNRHNLDTIREVMTKAINMTKDPNCVIMNFKNEPEISPEALRDDFLGTLLAGIDTSAHTFASTVYFLCKNPRVKAKLVEELKEHGLYNNPKIGELLTADKIQEMDYLNNVVKESLRRDPPATDTLGYIVVEDCTIRGVPLKKGQYMKINIFSSHHSEVEYHKPFEYIPERFDHRSEYFHKPGTKKVRGPYTWIPFSHSYRGCPGYSLSVLAIKVMVAFICSTFDFSVDEEFLKKEGIGFAHKSGIKLEAKFKKLV